MKRNQDGVFEGFKPHHRISFAQPLSWDILLLENFWNFRRKRVLKLRDRRKTGRELPRGIAVMECVKNFWNGEIAGFKGHSCRCISIKISTKNCGGEVSGTADETEATETKEAQEGSENNRCNRNNEVSEVTEGKEINSSKDLWGNELSGKVKTLWDWLR